jgi:hypothetical protein
MADDGNDRGNEIQANADQYHRQNEKSEQRHLFTPLLDRQVFSPQSRVQARIIMDDSGTALEWLYYF